MTAEPVHDEGDLKLDSTFFVAFDLTHRALKSGLAAASPLNVTQYRTLVKLLAAGERGVAQSDLGAMLDLKPNVVTQAVNALASAGFARRRRAEGSDGRVRTACVTEAGASHVARVNASIVERLYALFPTEDAAHRSILEASIAAGAGIDPEPSEGASGRYAASRALVSLELVKHAMEEALLATCGASLNECRVLQRLGEVGEPLRIVDIASQLQMTSVAVARTVDRLSERGWVVRLASPSDRKAVFAAATAQGERKQRAVARTVDTLARTQLWSRLDDGQRRALARAWRVVIADVQARKEAERKAALGRLQPLA